MQHLSYFVGTWLARAENPLTGGSFTLSYRIAPILEGAWLQGEGEAPEMGLRMRDLWGHDPVGGEIVRVVFDSQGTYGTVRSRGWEGEMLVLEGEARATGGAVTVRETITRLGPDAFRAVWEMRTAEGWQAYSLEQLTRQADA